MNKIPLNEKQASDCFLSLSNITRIQLFRLLMRRGSNGLNISEIQNHLEIPASTLSHHLSILVRAALITQKRVGRETVCNANYPNMHGLVNFLTDKCCKM